MKSSELGTSMAIMNGDSGPQPSILPPEAPENLDIDDTSVVGGVILTWDQDSAPTTNEIWRSINGAAYTLIASIAGALTTYTDTDTASDFDLWEYKIRALTGGLYSDFTIPSGILFGFFQHGDTGATVYSYPTVIVHIGDLDISEESVLTTISFPRLRHSSGYIAFYDNPLLDSLDLSTFATTPSIFQMGGGCPALVAFATPSLTTVGNYLNVGNAPVLEQYSAPILTSIGGNLYFNNPTSPNLNALSFALLTVIGADISGGSATSLITFNVPVLTTVGVIDMPLCTSLVSQSFPALVTAGTTINFNSCSSLVTFSAPSWIITDGSSLDFIGCALSAASVNHILARAVASGMTSGLIDLSGGTNAAPTGQGITDKSDLITAGVTVNTN